MEDPLLTAAVLEERYRIPEKTWAQWRYLGRGPKFLKLNGHVRYRQSDLDAWFAACERDATSD